MNLTNQTQSAYMRRWITGPWILDKSVHFVVKPRSLWGTVVLFTAVMIYDEHIVQVSKYITGGVCAEPHDFRELASDSL